nr:uncharacterized protein LOC111989131 [Quercus suber]
MRVPQKMKNFVWRACRDAIPTKQALVKRTIITDPFCDRCETETENSLHALWACSEVDIVWADLSLWSLRNHVEFGDFKQLVSWIAAEGKHLELFVFTAWSIWQQSNKVRVRAAATALHQVAEVARNALAEYHSRIADTNVQDAPRCHRLQIKWRPPPANVAKINFDGAVFSKENNSGIGVVVRNEQGLVLGSCSKRLLQAYSPIEIETMAAATALAFASELGVRRAVLEGDSLAVIKALRECDYPFTPTGLLLEDVSLFSHSFDTLLYSHTKREGNSVAHNLAKYAISIPDFLVWMEDVPPHIQYFVQADLACFS